jgi:hypothetical protein
MVSLKGYAKIRDLLMFFQKISNPKALRTVDAGRARHKLCPSPVLDSLCQKKTHRPKPVRVELKGLQT